MSITLYQNLEWYPSTPVDFDDQLESIFLENIKYNKLIKISKHRLSSPQTNKIYNRIKKVQSFGKNNSNLKNFSLGIISNSTTSHLKADIVVAGIRHGLNINVVETPFDQLIQIATGEVNPFEDVQLDLILLAIDLKGYALHRINNKFGGSENASSNAINFLAEVCEKLKSKFNVSCICQTLPHYPETYFGNIDANISGTNRNFINQFNMKLIDKLNISNDYIFDVASISETVGTNLWHDKTMYYYAKLPFAQVFVPLYAENLARIIGAITGKTKKVLITDLDNTLWGGVIGDDGINGIKLGGDESLGEIYQDIQKTILNLRNRGIVIAVCSKNDERIARNVFKNHSEMILKEEHITVFQSNWNDKPSNIKIISETLNLSLDSFVFIDDNPMERDIVRSYLPEVAVPELNDDPSSYMRTLLAGGYFESIVFSDEDTKRVDSYTANFKRSSLLGESADLKSYLKTLKMKADIKSFQEKDLDRIIQLILRSNQFNLTTKRYKIDEIKKFIDDEKYITFQVRLEDIFGDNGLISIIICKEDNNSWEIDTWIMSCRVLGRKVEEFVLSQIQNLAIKNGISELRGIYIKTPKNGLVKDHYKKLGFSLIKSKSNSDHSYWKFKIKERIENNQFINLK